MKTPAIISFCLLVILTGCNGPASVKADETEDERFLNPEKTTYTFSEGKEIKVFIDTNYYNGVEEPYVRNFIDVTDGDNIVFKYSYYYPEDYHIDDDEVVDNLTFEIDKNLTEFEYLDSEITKTKCSFQLSCFCPVRGVCLVKSGIISGKKISSSEWQISACVVIYYPHNNAFPDFEPRAINFKGTFKRTY